MLDQVRERVTALVPSDPAWQAGFDAYGCLRPAWWRDREIPLQASHVRVVERPADQAAEVVCFLAELDGHYAAEEITVGVPDETLVPLIEGELQRAGVPARYGPGRSVEASRPVRLVRAMIQYLTDQRLEDFVDLLRHPDLFAWLRQNIPGVTDEMAKLDDFVRERLIDRTVDVVFGDDEASASARRLMDQVGELLGPLMGSPRPPAEWAAGVFEVLASVYGGHDVDPDVPADRLVLGGGEMLRDGLIELQRVPADLVRPVAASEALLMAIASQSGRQASAAAATQNVELLGWLELPLDDAPVLAVTQFNEGTIPKSASSDLFLPDTLRAHLGLDDNCATLCPRRVCVGRADPYTPAVCGYCRPARRSGEPAAAQPATVCDGRRALPATLSSGVRRRRCRTGCGRRKPAELCRR